MIRHARREDLDAVLMIYARARGFMRASGNTTQWDDSYPSRDLLEKDVGLGQLYVLCDDGATGPSGVFVREDVIDREHQNVCNRNNNIYGVFAFIIGEEPTYARIVDGSWRSGAPYGTIHRIASDGSTGGVFESCVEFCTSKINHIRIDTHRDNRIMRHLVEKHGFHESGTIFVYDGSPRIAYEYERNDCDGENDR